MNLRDLEYLVALAEHRHFSRAAEASLVSQPTLSTQVRKLERELGVELLERSSGRVLLTAVGEQVVEHARAILRETQHIRDVARLASDPESGTVKVGLFPTIAPYLLPHIVPEVHRTLPNLELLIVEEKTAVLLDQVRDGRLDAVVVALPIDGPGLHAHPLFDETFVVALPADHPLATPGVPMPAAELASLPLLLLEEGHCLRDQALAFCEASGATERLGFRATSLETLRHMVAAGVGVTLLPALAVAPPVRSSEAIVLRPVSPPAPRRTLGMVWRDTSPFAQFFPRLADLFARLPDGLAGVSRSSLAEPAA